MHPIIAKLIVLVDTYLELAERAEAAAKLTTDQATIQFHVGRAAGLREAAEALMLTITETGSDAYA
jgi:hypothetical protein